MLALWLFGQDSTSEDAIQYLKDEGVEITNEPGLKEHMDKQPLYRSVSFLRVNPEYWIGFANRTSMYEITGAGFRFSEIVRIDGEDTRRLRGAR